MPRSPRGTAHVVADGVPPGVRRSISILICVAHVAAIYGLLQVGAVREAVREAVPIFAGLIQPQLPTAEPKSSPPPPTVHRAAPRPIIAAPPAPAQATPEFVVPSMPADTTVAPEAPPAPLAAADAPPVAQPRALSATEVGYLEPPRVTYPPVSRRLGEEGRVLLRVLVDPHGRPEQVLLLQTSGYARLDDAAAGAARRARFRPYTENGVARTVWVMLPIVFTLEVKP